MIDLSLSDDEQALRELARRVARRGFGEALTTAAEDGHLDVIDFRGAMDEAARAGIQGLLIPEEYGGGGQGAVAVAIVAEELGAVDAGLAAALNLTMCVPQMLVVAGTDEQRSELLPLVTREEAFVIAGALNESDIAGSEIFDPSPTAERGIRTRARRTDGGWVLTGRKAGWVSNAGVADAYVVFARSEPGVPAPVGTTAFWVPASAPGLSTGRRTSMLGLRSSFHAEVVLDEVVVPDTRVLGPVGGGLLLMQESTAAMVVGLAAVFVGVARAGYELALAHADRRESWGVAIRDHQAVQLLLADAATTYRRARLAVLEAAWTLDAVARGVGDLRELGMLLPAAKQHAVEAAIANAERAVKVHGAAGVATGLGPEKLLRDAWTGWSCDFTGDILRLATAAALPRPGLPDRFR